MNTINEEKKRLRKELLSMRDRMDEDVWRKQSDQIVQRLLEDQIWQKTRHIAIYYSVNKEVDTLNLIQHAWHQDKAIYLPVTIPSENKLSFFQVTSFEQLESGRYGIPEPKPNTCKPLITDELELVIVPGLLFNLQGYRLGYGGGYYDRFLGIQHTQAASFQTLSLAFDYQISSHDNIPIDAYDIPVDRIITNSKVIDCVQYRE